MNQIFTHPGQPQMQVEVILASRSTVEGAPVIYTIRMRYPRIIHGEIMTHRVFSRNARSSRAVPVRTMLLETTTIPFIPWHWGANQKGMQATEECNAPVTLATIKHANGGLYYRNEDFDRENAWLSARDAAVNHATAFMDAGYHKQNVNRLLEPFSWIDTLITSTDWANFLHLRDHKDAEPHLQDLARLVKQAIEEATVWKRSEGEWHLPYVNNDDRRLADRLFDASPPRKQEMVNEFLCKISAARCARISYKPFDGDASYERELERYGDLVTSDRVHASPLEHQAQADTGKYLYYPVTSSDDTRIAHLTRKLFWEKEHLSGNLGGGWIQARKLVPNECYKGAGA